MFGMDKNNEMPDDFDYAGLQADLDELERMDPDVKAAADHYETVKRILINQLPAKMVVDAEGFCWRVFQDGSWSMALTNPANEPVPQPVTTYVPEEPQNGPDYARLHARAMVRIAELQAEVESFPAGSDSIFADCCSATCAIDVLKKEVVKRGELTHV